MLQRSLILLIALALCGFVVDACGHYGGDSDLTPGCLDPTNPIYDDPGCVDGRERLKDAGADGSDASTNSGASSARCTCVKNAPDSFHAPQPVWIGPTGQAPMFCSDDVGAFGARRYTDLDPPASGCPVCVCGPIEGSCSPEPNSIMVRAGICGQSEAATIDFAAPENWDGSCTNVNAIPAGVECPPGSGIPCTQSVYVSALPDPVQGCAPIPMPVAKAISDVPKWKQSVVSCNATSLDVVCEGASSTCLPQPEDSRWRFCVRHEQDGVHDCPTEGEYTDQVIAYSETGYKDTRKCTECACEVSSGACYASFRVYEDGACTKLLTADVISSDAPNCDELPPGGPAVGSKEIADLQYDPGKCTPTGGLPTGTVEPDPTNAVTWCCRVPIE